MCACLQHLCNGPGSWQIVPWTFTWSSWYAIQFAPVKIQHSEMLFFSGSRHQNVIDVHCNACNPLKEILHCTLEYPRCRGHFIQKAGVPKETLVHGCWWQHIAVTQHPALTADNFGWGLGLPFLQSCNLHFRNWILQFVGIPITLCWNNLSSPIRELRENCTSSRVPLSTNFCSTVVPGL